MKKVSILSLSLLTVMAGAAVAPALGVIREHFSDSSQMAVQLIISMPALFIFSTSFIFPKLTQRFRVKTLVMIGLVLYVAGGCLAGVCSSIYLVLAFRALVGIGVGIIMPLSTGLLAFYYPPEQLDGLMGLSSAMNQMGGVIATLISGMLAQVSWRASFLVYALGLLCIILCMIFLPNDKLSDEEEPAEGDTEENAGRVESEIIEIKKRHPFARYYPFIITMFLLMMTFFLYPANFAIETIKEGIFTQKWISVIMAGMDLVAFFGGLCFVHIKKIMGRRMLMFAPLVFLAGYALLAFGGGRTGPFLGSALVGFANGSGIPAIISEASQRAGRQAVSSVMPLLSAAIYLGQFLAPFAMSGVSRIFAGTLAGAGPHFHLPYYFAIVICLLMIVWNVLTIICKSEKLISGEE